MRCGRVYGSCALSCHASSPCHPMCRRPAWFASSRAWPRIGAELDERIDHLSSEIAAVARQDAGCIFFFFFFFFYYNITREGAPRSARATCFRRDATSPLGWASSPKQISTGDRSILGKISKRGNRYLRVLFVQAAWVVLIKPKSWERHGLKPWIEAAKKRLHRNVLAIALANKLARIAWSVLAHGRNFEARKIDEAATQTV